MQFAKLDTDAAGLAELAKELGVTALPVFKVFKAGKEVASVTGYKKAALADAVAKAT